ncbi:MAG: VWA domain-containing protein [Terracidiphilus sp.]|jgi:VWFA-related protein
MQKLVLLLLAAEIALPAFAAKRVTTDQLEKVLASVHGRADAKVAQQLANLELSERLSAAKLTRWEADLPGPESRQALVALADASAFLDPPTAEIPATPPPDVATQRQIVALAVDYASKTISRLPDFFATRDTIRYEDTPPRQLDNGSVTGTFTPYQPLHPVARSSDVVFYRDGKEVVDSEAAKDQQAESAASGLTTWGEFGPILTTVLVDAAQGTMGWSHWEQGTAGPRAVFSYAVPKAKSHYEVNYCCVQRDNRSRVFKQLSGYRGEIAIDPANGTILRLTVAAELGKADPIVKADMLVEYGPVEIGGATYICPLKSVSISLAQEQDTHAVRMQRFSATMVEQNNQNIPKPMQTLLDDVAFEQYHVFRAESSIVTGDNADTGSNPPASSSADAKGSGSPASAVPPVAAASAEAGAPVAPAAPVSASAPAQPPVPELAVPEISVAESTGLPEPAATPLLTPGAGFTLHVTGRLVDVGVVALDKKGHPVTELKPEDFEIYDNGRKQAVRFFSQASGASAEESAKAPGQPGHAPDQPVFSNRRADTVDAQPGAGVTEGSTTILLLDPSNLAWPDLTYARGEMLRFLQSLPANELVGLYVMNALGFQVLEEGTADHALLASKLHGWMPSAQDLAQAQEMEQRNRQQFDYVFNPTDLQSVNGNINVVPDTATMVDPQLRDNGSNPGRSAFTILAGVARHVAAIPGHKNLVWITSDNVLADWTNHAAGSDKGSKYVEGYVLRAQEALNDAHVSVYPLDASQLETNAIDPSLLGRNVQLAPSVTAPPPPQAGGQAPGRVAAEMQQNVHPIQAAIQEMAEATGGRAFRRSGQIAKNLDEVIADGRAAYLLGFTPDTPADDQYHLLTVKLVARRGVTLRYRTGYEYAKEPATLKERFQRAVWQSLDVSGIAVSANPIAASQGATLKLNIATSDLALKQQAERWVDKLDIFLIQRDDEGLQARVTGQTLSLTLKPATYAKLLQEGIPFDQYVEKQPETGSLRIVVVDENSGRMGSVTVPSAVLKERADM